MTVPEAAMYEYHHPIFRKHDIRLSRKILAMKAKTISEVMQQ